MVLNYILPSAVERLKADYVARIGIHKESMSMMALSDDFYFTNGKRDEDMRVLHDLELVVALCDSFLKSVSE